MDFSGFKNLCIPVLVCNQEGIVLYKNELFRKRFSFLRMGNAITRYIAEEDQAQFIEGLQTGAPCICKLTQKGSIRGRGLLMQLTSETFLLVFFAELQPIPTDAIQAKLLKSIPGILEFFRALIAEDEQTQASPEQRLLSAEEHSGALSALLLDRDLILGQTTFDVISLFEALLVGLRSDLKHCGAQILFHNHASPFVLRYSDSHLLPLSLIKLMLFALLTTKEKRIDVEFSETAEHQPCFDMRFQSLKKLPIMLEVSDFRVFAARYPHLYPMLFGYVPALFKEGGAISLNVGEDGQTVSLRVTFHCMRERTITLNAPEEEEKTLRILRAILRYTTVLLNEV